MKKPSTWCEWEGYSPPSTWFNLTTKYSGIWVKLGMVYLYSFRRIPAESSGFCRRNPPDLTTAFSISHSLDLSLSLSLLSICRADRIKHAPTCWGSSEPFWCPSALFPHPTTVLTPSQLTPHQQLNIPHTSGASSPVAHKYFGQPLTTCRRHGGERCPKYTAAHPHVLSRFSFLSFSLVSLLSFSLSLLFSPVLSLSLSL